MDGVEIDAEDLNGLKRLIHGEEEGGGRERGKAGRVGCCASGGLEKEERGGR